MSLAIATGPNKSVYSETFIKAQVDLLPCSLKMYGFPYPFETDPGESTLIPRRSLRFPLRVAQKALDGNTQPIIFYELKERLKKNNVSCILANYGITGVSLLPLTQSLGIKLFVHFHGFDAHEKSVVDGYLDGYRRLGQHASGIIAVSEYMRKCLIEIGIPEGKIHLVRYGADQHLFRSSQVKAHPPIFLSVGRFVDKKAPYLTLLAFYRAKSQIRDAKLVMVGEGELMEATRNIAVHLGMLDCVEFKGALAAGEVAELMKKSSIFLQHSLSPLVGPHVGDAEGTPVAIIEAQMSSLPVISTWHAGIQDIIEDGVNGFLVPERDVNMMSERMVLLANNSALRERMGRKAREMAQKSLSLENYISQLAEIVGIHKHKP